MKLILFLAALAAFATAQPVTQPLPGSSAEALALARAINIGPFEAFPHSADRIAAALSRNLLNTVLAWRGPGCDPRLPACRAAADRLSREAAPRILAEQRERSARMVAVLLDASMTAAEMRAALDFVHTPAGQSLARALPLTMDFTSAAPSVRAKVEALLVTPPSYRESELAERFYDATKELPRGQMLAPPPPVSPPSLQNRQ